MDNIKNFNSADNSGKGYKITIVVLGIVLIGLAILTYIQKTEHTKNIASLEQVNHEKETLTFQYQGLLDDYESLETTSDSISSQLDSEKERIKELIADLRTTKSNNRYQINKYKNELKTLRSIMKGFIHQVDSLNTLNIELTAENKEIKKQYKTARDKNKKLSEKYDEAADKVKVASVIRAIDIVIASLNHKGKSTSKAKKTKRFSINFALDENAIAKTGTKSIYLRITDPNEHILIQDNQPVFSYEDEEIAYSSVRKVEYDGKVSNAVIYFEHKGEERLMKGIYKVDIFCDGNMIGSSDVKLN